MLKLTGYFILVLGIYAIALNIGLRGSTKVVLNNAILLALATFIYILERPKKIII
jgi:hypothetical protein